MYITYVLIGAYQFKMCKNGKTSKLSQESDEAHVL